MPMEEFLTRCEQVRKRVLAMDHPLVVGHYDADGLAATALIAKALRLEHKQFSVMTVDKLAEPEVEQLGQYGEIVFCDLGSSSLDNLGPLKSKNVAIIDHHQVAGNEDPNELLQANGALFGLDGATELSGASTAYFVFRRPELISLGIAGAVGDMQAPLRGPNRTMLADGIKAGTVSAELDLQPFGRISRPLVQFLSYCTEPFLPGLTGDNTACARFLKDLGIPLKAGLNWRSYADLSLAEKQTLATGLICWLRSANVEPAKVHALVGECYVLHDQPARTELSDAKEFATMLNACGRHGKPDIGIKAALGDKEAFETARTMLEAHRKTLREGVTWASANVNDWGKIHFLDARGVIEEHIVGTIAGMLYGSTISRDKPVFAAAAKQGEGIKVSARATFDLTDKGLNLGAVLKTVCEPIGGAGGGHRVAAGATVPEGKLNDFLLGLAEAL